MLERFFTAEEGLEGRHHIALIRDAFWKSHYQRDPKILGRTMSINDQPYTTIEVLPTGIPGWLHGEQTLTCVWAVPAGAGSMEQIGAGRAIRCTVMPAAGFRSDSPTPCVSTTQLVEEPA
jgi:hypothetical protein